MNNRNSYRYILGEMGARETNSVFILMIITLSCMSMISDSLAAHQGNIGCKKLIGYESKWPRIHDPKSLNSLRSYAKRRTLDPSLKMAPDPEAMTVAAQSFAESFAQIGASILSKLSAITESVSSALPSAELIRGGARETLMNVVSNPENDAIVAGLIFGFDGVAAKNQLEIENKEQEERIKRLMDEMGIVETVRGNASQAFESISSANVKLLGVVQSLTSQLGAKELEFESLKERVDEIARESSEFIEDRELRLRRERERSERTLNDKIETLAGKLRESESRATATRTRELEAYRSVKNFLLDNGYISSGIHNLLTPETTIEALRNCSMKADLKEQLTARLRETEVAVEEERSMRTSEAQTLQKQVATLTSELAARAQAEKVLEKQVEIMSKDILGYKYDVQVSREREETLAGAVGNFLVREAYMPESQARQLLGEDLISSLKNESMTSKKFDLRGTLDDVQESMKLLQQTTSLQTNELKRRLAEVEEENRMLGMKLSLTEEKLSLMGALDAKRLEAEAYMSQLRSENEELKQKLLASDEKLWDVQRNMQLKLETKNRETGSVQVKTALSIKKASEMDKEETADYLSALSIVQLTVDTEGERVTLFNPSSSPLSLRGGFYLADSEKSVFNTLYLPDDTMLPANGGLAVFTCPGKKQYAVPKGFQGPYIEWLNKNGELRKKTVFSSSSSLPFSLYSPGGNLISRSSEDQE